MILKAIEQKVVKFILIVISHYPLNNELLHFIGSIGNMNIIKLLFHKYFKC